jgi:hypothetical protein
VLVGTALALPAVVLVTVLLARARRRRGVASRTARWSAVAEVGAVVGTVPWLVMTLLPNPGGESGVALVPFRDLADLLPRDVLVQVVGNLAVFAAAGALLPVRWARAGARPSAVLLPVAAAAVLGASAVEGVQHVLQLGRVSSVDDVLLNAAGAVLGAVAGRRWWGAGRPTGAPPPPGPVAAAARRGSPEAGPARGDPGVPGAADPGA